jgi:hypothetical protein
MSGSGGRFAQCSLSTTSNFHSKSEPSYLVGGSFDFRSLSMTVRGQRTLTALTRSLCPRAGRRRNLIDMIEEYAPHVVHADLIPGVGERARRGGSAALTAASSRRRRYPYVPRKRQLLG